MKPLRAGLLAMVLSALLPSGAWSRIPATSIPEPKFEVASIKPNHSDPTGMKYGTESATGRFTAINTPLEILIFTAYGVLPFEMVGVTDWMKSDRFDVLTSVSDTTHERPVDASVTKQMLQALLAERFQLRVHRETRQLPFYRLVFARQDKALGSGIHKSDCDAYRLEVERWKTGQGTQPAFKACGHSLGGGQDTVSLRYGGVSIHDFARDLAGDVLQRAVVDETGLAGSFDIRLDIARESLRMYGAPSPTNNGPSVFEALPAQLGLKLEPSRGPVEVLVIDHAEQPTPD